MIVHPVITTPSPQRWVALVEALGAAVVTHDDAGNPGTKRGGFVTAEANHRPIKHIALNLVEEVGTGHATGNADRIDFAAELFDEIKTVLHFDGNAFEDGARHFTPRRFQRQLEQGATGLRIPMRRTAALEMGQQDEAIGSGWRGGGGLVERLEVAGG